MMTALSFVIILFTAHVLVTRPYRSMPTNILYAMALIGVSLQCVLLRCVVAGYEQAIFVDKFFFVLTCILNGFIWFLIFIGLIGLAINGLKWPTNREVIFKLTEGQDLAIYYIKLSRAFMDELKDKKCYSDEDRSAISLNLENLSV